MVSKQIVDNYFAAAKPQPMQDSTSTQPKFIYDYSKQMFESPKAAAEANTDEVNAYNELEHS